MRSLGRYVDWSEPMSIQHSSESVGTHATSASEDEDLRLLSSPTISIDPEAEDNDLADEDDDNAAPDEGPLLAVRQHDPEQPPCRCTFTLIPKCASRHWKRSCTCCAMLLVVVVALLLALVAGTIVWAVEANRRSHRNISFSTYKEAVSLSETDHFFLENVCISASTSPPNSLQVEIAAMECIQPTMTDTSFRIQGVLMKGLQRSSDAQQKYLVDHALVFYWHRGTVIKLVTSVIPFQVFLDFDVTVFVLNDESAFLHCTVDHVVPNKVFFVKWSVSPSSQQCQVANNGDVTCDFIYNVTQSNMHYICILRKEPVIPPLHTYTYNLTGEVKSYDISQAQPQSCNLSHPNSPCCAPYGSVFTKTCIIIQTDLPVESVYSEDLGTTFTVAVSSNRRRSVLWLSVGLAIVLIMTALVLIFLCVATLKRARN